MKDQVVLQRCPICLRGPVVQREESKTLGLRTRRWWACRACGSVLQRTGHTYRYDAISKHHPDMHYLLEAVFYDLDELGELADQRYEQATTKDRHTTADRFQQREPANSAAAMSSVQSQHGTSTLNEQVQRNLQAIELEKSGRVDEAIELYEENVRGRFPGSQPYDRLASIYRERGLTDEEIRVLEKAVWVLVNLANIGVLDKTARRKAYERRLAEAWGIDEWPECSPGEAQVSDGLYDRRHSPYHSYPLTEPEYPQNPHILKWWTPSHDELMATLIQEQQWDWASRITDQIVEMTPEHVIQTWKAQDPQCTSRAWYNALYDFAISRAHRLGLTKAIRRPERRMCPLCGCWFVEDSLPSALIQRLGIDRLNFCAPRLKTSVLQQTGNDSLPREDVVAYLRSLTDVLQRVPSQGFGEGVDDLRGLSTHERVALLKLLQRKPSVRRVKELFGSWFKALIEAEVLDDDARRLSRGTQCLAKDGHICFSLGEKTIDDTLYSLGIPHEKEVTYPEGGYRADFAVRNVFIEYFGLTGNPQYDARARQKKEICQRYDVKLICIYPSDLTSPERLASKLTKGVAV
jgi:tetratricopeptide (TPR) repeat protein